MQRVKGTESAAANRPGGRLAPMIFSTETLPVGAQFTRWRERWQDIIEIEQTGAPEAGYRATNRIWDLGDFAISRVTAPGLLVRRTARQVRRDQIDTWFLACARSGFVEHRVGDQVSRVEAGVPALYSMGEAFESLRSDVEWVTIFFSRDYAAELNAGLEEVRNRPLDTPLGRLAADFFMALKRRLPEMGTDDVGSVAAMTRQMLAACLAPTRDRLAEAQPAIDHTRRERVRLALRRHMGSPGLTPGKLCRLVGISRSNLYRLFEAEGGVAYHIQAVRMRAAHAMLSDLGNVQPIHLVAESVGFADAASFSRRFRRTFGCTPRDVRRMTLEAGAGTAPPSARRRADNDLPALLRRL